jgi:hypothetical protein
MTQTGTVVKFNSERADPNDSGANDEQVPRLPNSKAHQSYLAGPCNGHDALPAGRKFPSLSKKARLRWQRYSSSHPPMWRDSRPSDIMLAFQRIRCFHPKKLEVLRAEHRFTRAKLCGGRVKAQTPSPKDRRGSSLIINPDFSQCDGRQFT